MSATVYLRTGSDLQYLHLKGCPRTHWWRRPFLRVGHRWAWANETKDANRLARVVSALNIRCCRVCQPFGSRVAE